MLKRIALRNLRSQVLIVISIVSLAYLYGLNSARMPTIGDEIVYMEITRATKVSGNWLPLRDPFRIWNTKPPLLFWQGMVSTPNDIEAKRWQYRWPSLIWTWLVALSLFYFMRRWLQLESKPSSPEKNWSPPLLASVFFLGFLSTYQHGRPFLMHSWEQLGLVLPAFLVLGWGLTWPIAIGIGLLWGIAALYKSFILVFVGGLAILVLQYFRKPRPDLMTETLPRLATAGAMGLAMFSLWFFLDPQPELIYSQFLLGENAGKLQTMSYWQGLISGVYPLTRIWLGSLVNSGVFVFVMVGLLIVLFRMRKNLPPTARSLLMYILVFLVVYSVPSQRQENYILPVMAMWAALLARYWQDIGKVWLSLTAGFLVIYGVFVFIVLHKISLAYEEVLVPIYTYVILGTVVLPSVLAIFSRSWAQQWLPIAGLVFCHSLSVVADSFAMRVPSSVVADFAHKTVVMPSNFRYAHSTYRFEFPGAFIMGYTSIDEALRFLDEGKIVALPASVDLQETHVGTLKKHFSWPVLRERMSVQEINDILTTGAFDLLLTPLQFVSH